MLGVKKACHEIAESLREMQQENDQLKAENAKLKKELEAVGAAAYLYGRSDLKAENAKLRELAHLVAEYVSADQCEGCVAKRACNAGMLDMCWIRKAILEKLRELGVEVHE